MRPETARSGYGAAMRQMSLFSADVAAPTRHDLGGLLAAHGQIARGRPGTDGTVGVGSRLSILVAERWRADALLAEFARRDVPAALLDVADTGLPDELPDHPESAALPGLRTGFVVRSERSAGLDAVADAWTRGSVKEVPALPVPAGGFLRCWALAAGAPDEAGYLLGTDARAEQTHSRLASALSGIGLTGTLLGLRGGGPGVRIVGRRRLDRLAELLGEPPAGAPDGAFPAGR